MSIHRGKWNCLDKGTFDFGRNLFDSASYEFNITRLMQNPEGVRNGLSTLQTVQKFEHNGWVVSDCGFKLSLS